MAAKGKILGRPAPALYIISGLMAAIVGPPAAVLMRFIVSYPADQIVAYDLQLSPLQEAVNSWIPGAEIALSLLGVSLLVIGGLDRRLPIPIRHGSFVVAILVLLIDLALISLWIALGTR